MYNCVWCLKRTWRFYEKFCIKNTFKYESPPHQSCRKTLTKRVDIVITGPGSKRKVTCLVIEWKAGDVEGAGELDGGERRVVGNQTGHSIDELSVVGFVDNVYCIQCN